MSKRKGISFGAAVDELALAMVFAEELIYSQASVTLPTPEKCAIVRGLDTSLDRFREHSSTMRALLENTYVTEKTPEPPPMSES